MRVTKSGKALFDAKAQRTMTAILRVLRSSARPVGSDNIARQLRLAGIELSERTIRNYLARGDGLGWTENLGRRGRRLTPLGIQEVESARVIEKVGFVAARIDELVYQMTFDPASRRGKVILNISLVARRHIRRAMQALQKVYRAGLTMGRLIAVGRPGDEVGDFRVPRDAFAIGTVCSVTLNGLLVRASIATNARFGGLLELEHGRPKRFVHVIHYDGSSLDPLEIFIRGRMTSVNQAVRTGSGVIGASFREVPALALTEVRRLVTVSERAGLGGVLAVGGPDQPLLDIPVGQGRAGIVVCAGLNAAAAMVEAGIPVISTAMATLCDFEHLEDYSSLQV